MGLDLGPQAYRTEVTERSWPKCRKCTVRLQDMPARWRALQGISLPYPVERYELVTRETPRETAAKFALVVRADCHGETHQFVVEVPRRWGQTAELQALGLVDCFIPNGRGGYSVELNQQRLWSRGYRDLTSSVR